LEFSCHVSRLVICDLLYLCFLYLLNFCITVYITACIKATVILYNCRLQLYCITVAYVWLPSGVITNKWISKPELTTYLDFNYLQITHPLRWHHCNNTRTGIDDHYNDSVLGTHKTHRGTLDKTFNATYLNRVRWCSQA